MADELRPATHEETEETIAFAFRYRGRKRFHQGDSFMANVTAKHLEATLAGQKAQLELPTEVQERLGLNAKSISDYSSSVAARFEKVSRRYNAI